MFNIEKFKLSPETTYDQFEYAVRSNQFPAQNLFPDSYSILHRRFTHQNNSDLKLHLHCADETAIYLWPIRQFGYFSSFEEIVQSLIRGKGVVVVSVLQ